MLQQARTIALGLLLIGLHQTAATAQHWYKGNLHTHSLWSDGNNYPEIIAQHYKEHGYHFLALTEHNLFQNTEKWVGISPGTSAKRDIFNIYSKTFGEAAIDLKRWPNDSIRVRLKRLEEYRIRFEEPGKFLLINSEEITSQYDGKPVHVNGINMKELIPRQEGTSNIDVLQHVADAMLSQEKKTGTNMLFIIDHPNFWWALTANDIMQVKGATFFELFNAGSTGNYGDSARDHVELMWDKINAHHIKAGEPLMYGVATDDSHGLNQAARGWVMVNAPQLTPEAIVTAMEAGNFYASSGVTLDKILMKDKRLSVRVKKEAGVTFNIQFIGVKKGAQLPVVLSEQKGSSASYQLKEDDLFVRAKIISSKLHYNPHQKGDTEVAWTQLLKN